MCTVDFNAVSFHVESGYRLRVVQWNGMIYCTRKSRQTKI